MNDDKPQVGSRVSLFYPGHWERFGTVIETDYHPLGIEDSIKIRFEDMPVNREPEWWDLRYVREVELKRT